MADKKEAAMDPRDAARRDPAAVVRRWAAALEHADYFTLLDVPVPKAGEKELSEADLRRAFHAFAERFHPDHYRSADREAQEAAAAVFRRGSEAYRVLKDPVLRKRYAEKLATGDTRLSHADIVDAARPPASTDKIIDVVKLPISRQFAAKADELIAAGYLRGAKMQLDILGMREPNNPLLKQRIQELAEKLAAGTAKPST